MSSVCASWFFVVFTFLLLFFPRFASLIGIVKCWFEKWRIWLQFHFLHLSSWIFTYNCLFFVVYSLILSLSFIPRNEKFYFVYLSNSRIDNNHYYTVSYHTNEFTIEKLLLFFVKSSKNNDWNQRFQIQGSNEIDSLYEFLR